jgi:hypothetical protein
MAERELIAFDRLPISAIWAEEVLCCGFQVQQLIIGRLPITNPKPQFHLALHIKVHCSVSDKNQ